MKLCKDCKWCRRSFFQRLFGAWNFAECASPKALYEIDPLSGESRPYVSLCISQREYKKDERFCGRAGNWFEPKDAK